FLRARCAGKRVLEYGCGQGKYTPRLAEFGGNVTGIDLSETAMANARASARAAGVEVEFKAMDAEALDFPEQTFDVICGTAILDRLDAALFRWLPFTARYAWYAVAVLSDPRPVAAAAVEKDGAGD